MILQRSNSRPGIVPVHGAPDNRNSTGAPGTIIFT
jgi:hypothetical protein